MKTLDCLQIYKDVEDSAGVNAYDRFLRLVQTFKIQRKSLDVEFNPFKLPREASQSDDSDSEVSFWIQRHLFYQLCVERRIICSLTEFKSWRDVKRAQLRAIHEWNCIPIWEVQSLCLETWPNHGWAWPIAEVAKAYRSREKVYWTL